jgi:hypothetical protein
MKAGSVRAVLIVVGAAVLLWLILSSQRQEKRGERPAHQLTPVPSPPPTPGQVVEQLRSHSGDPRHARRVLDELRGRLAAMTESEATRFLRSALASGVDAATGMDLQPDGKGGLNGWPSWRVFVLDQLRTLDPESARTYARSILETPTSPDEWAISLSIIATDTTAAGRDYLRQKSRQLATHEPWQTDPTAGFLEAFDVLVFNRDIEFIPQLSALLDQTNNRALAHAAFLTLDRLVQVAPVATLGILLERPEMLPSREATRAGYFARADMRDPAQLTLVERYLLDPGISAAERERFMATFPAASFMVSVNLLTDSTTPGRSEIAARDQAALQAVKGWMADPRFAQQQSALLAMRRRLEEFSIPRHE